jgi:CRP/FNR family cyclic AMP-dependent transcriptional regulator
LLLDQWWLRTTRKMVKILVDVSTPKLKYPVHFDLNVFFAKAGAGKTISRYREKDIVFSQSDPADGIFYIQKGKVKLTVVSARGKEAVVGILGEEAFFGEACLAGREFRMATATAMCACTIVRVEKSAALRMLRAEPAFSEVFLGYLLSRNIRIEEDLIDQLFNSSEKRLARVLLLLANYGKDSTREVVIAKISQATLAEIVGTTRSRISFFMNRFRKLGFIEYDSRGLQVYSSLLSVVLND